MTRSLPLALVLAAALLAAPAPAAAAAAGPDLTIAATHSGPFVQGDTPAAGDRFTLTVTNAGDASSSGTVTVTDQIRNGSGYNYVSTADTDPSWSCAQANQLVTCTRADPLAPGASYPPITIDVSVNSTADPSSSNSATVSSGDRQHTATDPIALVTKPDLVMHATLLGPFRQGDPADGYRLTVYNQGGAATSDAVTVTAAVPAGLSYVAAVGSGWSCSFAEPALTCSRSDPLAPGAPPNEPGRYSKYPEIYLYVAVAPDAPASVTLNTAVSGGGERTSPPPQGNGTNSSNRATPITPVGDLNTIVTPSEPFRQGGEGIYAIAARNTGQGPTVGPVSVTVGLGAGVEATRMTGPGWTCDLATVSCVRMTAAEAGTAFPDIALRVRLSRHAPGSVTTAVTIAGGGEIHTADDRTVVTSTVTQMPDLAVTLLANGPFVRGDRGTLTVTPANVGYAATTGMRTASIDVPRGFEVSALAGAGWTCALETARCVRSDALAPGAADPAITATLDVAADAPSEAQFVAVVAGGGQLHEDNDRASALAYLGPGPPEPDAPAGPASPEPSADPPAGPAPSAPPGAVTGSRAASQPTIQAGRRGRASFAVTCAAPCRLAGSVILSRAAAARLGATRRTLTRVAASQRLVLRVPARTLHAARRRGVRSLAVTFTITARDAGGRERTVRQAIRITT